MKPDLLKGHLDLMLLAILETTPLHGYAIIEALKLQSEGTFDLPEGTVYPALHRLERAGLLRSEWSTESPRKRRIYRISTRGCTELAARRDEWRRFSRGVVSVLGGSA